MPDNEVLISELSTKAVNTLTMFELENTTDGEPDSGKTDASALGNFFLGQGTSPLEYADLQTTAKTPIGAINELDDDIADKAEIDDSTISADSAYSSQKIISLMPTNEASGAVANFNTQIAAPLVDVTLQINAQQASGTPSPTNPLPITGFTGANIGHSKNNMLNVHDKTQTINNITLTAENGLITITGIPSAYTEISLDVDNIDLRPAINRLSFFNQVPSSGIVTVRFTRNGSNVHYWQMTSANRSVVNWTDTGNEYIDGIIIQIENGTIFTNNSFSLSPMLSVATDDYSQFYPYSGETKAIDWTDEVGTIYGGELDLLSGVLTVTHAKNPISELTSFNRATFSGVDYFQGFMNGKKLGVYNAKCEVFALGQTPSVSLMVNNTFMGDASYNKFYFRCDDITTATDFINQFGNYNIVYEFATPIEIQLTPQQMSAFVGVNNIWHDANGGTTVKFKQDIQGYIDSKIAEVEAMVLSLP